MRIKSIILFTLAALPFTLFSQIPITKYHPNEEGKIRERYSVSQNDSSIIIGDYAAYDTEGNLAVKGHYSSGQKDGEFINYYPNGVVQRSTFYKNNLREGIIKVFDQKENIIQKGTFKNDTLKGTLKTYFPNV